VTLNLSKDAMVPKANMPGHSWAGLEFNKRVTYLASYHDKITNGNKYIYLGAGSGWKGQSDYEKYEKAKRLNKIIDKTTTPPKRLIDKVREKVDKMLYKKGLPMELATAAYMIDKLALRCGNEKKEEDEEADTVGCCSLRAEHIKLGDDNELTLDFLGKDSIRYVNTIEVHPQVWLNLKTLTSKKKPDECIFSFSDNTSELNDFFKSFMPGLSAKVFRTYNASRTLQEQLSLFDKSEVEWWDEGKLTQFYNNANREVALLCNHQKAVSKGFDEGTQKLADKIKELKKERKAAKKAGQDGKVTRLDSTILRAETNFAMRTENKSVALGTSKTNYLDPRITVAFCKRVGLPIEKVFGGALRNKFPWAMHAKTTYRF